MDGSLEARLKSKFQDLPISRYSPFLFSAIRNNIESNRNDPDPNLTLGQMIKWLVCISSGMKYLSDKKMVHRDLRDC